MKGIETRRYITDEVTNLTYISADDFEEFVRKHAISFLVMESSKQKEFQVNIIFDK